MPPTLLPDAAHFTFSSRGDESYRALARNRGLQQNCTLAPRCGLPFRDPLPASRPSTPLSIHPSSTHSSRCTTPLNIPPSSAYTTPPSSRCHSPMLKPQDSLPVNINLEPFFSQDAEPTAILYEKAFANDGIRHSIFPPTLSNPSDPLAERHWRTQLFEMALAIPSAHIVKAVDFRNGKIVGAAGFFGPGGIQWDTEAQAEAAGVSLSNMPFCDAGKKKQYDDIVKQKRSKVLKDDREVWELAHVFVDPGYQGRGIGKALLERGIKLADTDGLPLYLEGTPAGRRLYEKLGFAVEEESVFDGVYHNGEPYKMYFMVRWPSGRIDAGLELHWE
ncbi:acyl-CoA N-acyltransferase [Lojkania enalia]|uniref:Acyl-CoA N-acyltransferase n=1 Tax=Lojkania enalia TaxID=147567 RepID=A0A9P4N737_9PLEO|nr:acyl-CoA N-acyltransferase [Didymosphaeria enalia]